MSAWSTIASAGCIDVRHIGEVELHGTLTYKIFAGPPGFEDVRKGDAPEPAYILGLDAPVCAQGDEFVDPLAKIDRVQVYVDQQGQTADRLYDELARLKGKKVAVRISSLDGAVTGHHHAPLIAALRSISLDAAVVPPPSQSVVKAFYGALSAGDGDEAASFVVPAKRRSGPFSPEAISRFYGRLDVRLSIVEIESRSAYEHYVRYRYKAPGRQLCEGRSIVTTTMIDGFNLIASIRALDGC
jgi:hypothetical protein